MESVMIIFQFQIAILKFFICKIVVVYNIDKKYYTENKILKKKV